MRAAIWTPLPPERSGIADYSFELLGALAREIEVLAVVRNGTELEVQVPPGIEVVRAADHDGERVDVDFYHMGNHARFHAYIYAQAMRRPGITVLHDPALVDFYKRLAGERSALFEAEARFNCTGVDANEALPTVEVRGKRQLDPMAVLMSRRLVEASAVTVVHSRWARDELSRRSPDARVVHIPEAAPLLATRLGPELPAAPLRLAVLGGISRPKRVLRVLDAYRAVRPLLGGARVAIVGRCDERELVREAERYLEEHQLGEWVELRCDVEDDELERVLRESHAVISLRWPTTGETSAVVMRAFGAGKVVIGSDVPQHRDFDERYYWRIPTELDAEGPALEEALLRAASDPVALARSGELARSHVVQCCSFERVAAQQAQLARDVAGRRALPFTIQVAERHREPPAVNAIASWEATTGITEAARRAVGGLLDAGVRVAIEDFDFGAPRERDRFPARLRSLPRGRPYGTDLIFLNINELHVASERYLRFVGDQRYVIGSWFWELPEVPAHIRTQIARVDEIWVATEFVAGTFRALTEKPVHVMPCVVEPVADPELGRKDFGLPEAKLLYFLQFDANSTLARKNPRGVIEAYLRAFSAAERATDVQLVVKTMNLASLPEAHDLLSSLLERVGGIVIDEELSAEEMASLTSLCDVYVSLHRAEGFGLGLAEAMYFGKPVIATGYSGNLDFMTPSNSCLVGYRMGEVTYGDLRFNPAAQYVYTPGSAWAVPDVDEAAKWMRYLYERPDLRGRLGAAAASRIRCVCLAANVGRLMRSRLEEVANAADRSLSI